MAKGEDSRPHVVSNWEKLKIAGGVVTGLLIPIVLIVITNLYASAQKSQDLNARYIELAIGILRDEPKQGSEGIRNWAVDVVNLHSEVKLDDTVRKQLIENRIIKIPMDTREFQVQQDMVPDGIVGAATKKRLDDRVRELLSNDEKIAAIKHVRNVLDLGLNEAKAYVEMIEEEHE